MYARHAEDAAPLFREFGAVRLVEGWGDDVPDGEVTDFKGAVKAKEDEAVVFGFMEYPLRKARDAANEKMRSDPRMQGVGANPRRYPAGRLRPEPGDRLRRPATIGR